MLGWNQGDIEFFFPHLDALPVERTLAVAALNEAFGTIELATPRSSQSKVIKPDAVQQGEKGGKTAEQVVEDVPVASTGHERVSVLRNAY